MPQPRKRSFAAPITGPATLDAQIEKLRQIVERAERLLLEFQRFEAGFFAKSPVRRRTRLPVH